jgi:hypothetical protein
VKTNQELSEEYKTLLHTQSKPCPRCRKSVRSRHSDDDALSRKSDSILIDEFPRIDEDSRIRVSMNSLDLSGIFEGNQSGMRVYRDRLLKAETMLSESLSQITR